MGQPGPFSVRLRFFNRLFGEKPPNELSGGDTGVLCGPPLLRDLRVFRCLDSRCGCESKD